MTIFTTALRRGAFCAAFAFSAVAVGATTAVTAPGAPVISDPVEVSYRNPAFFTEMRRDVGARRDWLDDLGRFVAKRAAAVVPPGQRLLVTITDVQRAGMVEPWHRAGTDLRVVRDTTPPRIDLSFQVVGPNGAVFREGSRQLRDMAFLRRHIRYSGDPLAYEKHLIDDWVREEFGAPRR